MFEFDSKALIDKLSPKLLDVEVVSPLFSVEDWVEDELLFSTIDDDISGRVDESDMWVAPNFLEFVTSKYGMSATILPRQLQIISELFGEICPFCSDPEVANNLYDQSLDEILDRVCFLRHSKCPKCKRTKNDIFNEGRYKRPDRGYIIAGQRSGKSILSTLTSSYQLHRYLTLRDINGRPAVPYKLFKNPPQPIYCTFTALTIKQVQENLWEPFKGYINESPWFKEYHSLLVYYGNKLGAELYRAPQTFLQYNHKKIGCLCEPPDKQKLRGKTRFFFSNDETSWFDISKDAKSKLGSAKEVLTAGNNSLLTLRNKARQQWDLGNFNCPTAIEFHTSSPAEVNDLMMRRLAESKSNPRIYAVRYATWEMNPDYRGPDDIGESDPVILWRDFGAQPPLADSPYYGNHQNVLRMISNTRKEQVRCSVIKGVNDFGDTYISLKYEGSSLKKRPFILAIDNGYTNNCFSATLLSLDKGKPIVEATFQLVPDEKKYVVNLAKTFKEFILPMVERNMIVMLAYDQWNSLHQIQELRDMNINAVKYSLTMKDFDGIRQQLDSMNCEFNKPFVANAETIISKDVAFDMQDAAQEDSDYALILQLLTVRNLGRVIAKPTTGDDDVFRSWALGFHLIVQPENAKLFTEISNMEKSSGTLGILRNRGQGSGGNVNMAIGGIARRRQ